MTMDKAIKEIDENNTELSIQIDWEAIQKMIIKIVEQIIGVLKMSKNA